MGRPKKETTEAATTKKKSLEPIDIVVRCVFIEPILGSAPADDQIYTEYIGSKAPDAKSKQEEIESLGVEEVIEKQKTIFSKLPDGTPHLWDYQIKGFMKNAAKAAYQLGEGKKLTAYKTKIDNLIFIQERKIPFHLYEGDTIQDCQRPLRAQTAQGDRVALANSEEIPEGAYIEFTIHILDPSLEKYVRDWMDYGKLNGLGQWHNSGKGRFIWKEIPGVIPKNPRGPRNFDAILNQ